jgi:hypothetical protein
MDAILFHCRDVCGVDVALKYASDFRRFEALTQFVYDGGQRYHNRLYHHIDKQEFQLSEAIKMVYRCDRKRV